MAYAVQERQLEMLQAQVWPQLVRFAQGQLAGSRC
jgi:hypothetical protein